MALLEATDREETFVAHGYEEHLVDTGEVRINYAVTGGANKPALLLIPAQGESWWGYEPAMRLLEDRYQVFAVDLRGQGRSTWTPGRYSLDTIGNDLVRFIDIVIGRPVVVSGLSSGGVVAAWLAAYAKPGQLRAALLEDPPVYASEATPAVGHSVRQAMGPVFGLFGTFLGDQWKVGDAEGMQKAFGTLPQALLQSLPRMIGGSLPEGMTLGEALREYDPEWGRSFATGTMTAGIDHQTMLEQVKVPVLFTHHFHTIDAETNRLLGASSDEQVAAARRAIESNGQPFTYLSIPEAPHSLHGSDPARYVSIVEEWMGTLADR